MSKRIEYLDSLRGLAALSVVVHHCFLLFPAFWEAHSREPIQNPLVWALTYTPLHLFWDGPEAVTFFFVLSGFVLALPYFYGKTVFYPSYLARRFFRIYVPYIVVVSGSALLLLFSLSAHPMPGTSEWFGWVWAHAVDFKEYLNLVLMRGGSPDNVDSPAWSLDFEMRISIIFPVICLIVSRLTGWVVLALAVFINQTCLPGVNYVNPFITAVVETLHYSSFFICGCWLAKYQEDVRNFLGKLQTWKRVALVLAALGLYNWGWEFWNTRPSLLVLNAPSSRFLKFAPGLGSALIIGSALAFEKLQHVLNHKLLLWTGKVSYSLYLTHMVVLPAAIYFLPPVIPLLGRVILGAMLSFPVAGLSYQFLEVPCISMGHFLAKKLEGPKPPASVEA
jgi:peptidoglycan/LPS O-acetylase OafA/YrhL